MNAPIHSTERQAFLRSPEAGLAPPLERLRLQIYLVQLLVDVGLLLLAFATLGAVFGGKTDPMLPANLLLPIYLTLALYNGTYSIDSLSSAKNAALRMFAALAISTALLSFVLFFAKISETVSRTAFFASISVAAALLAMSRYVAVRWVHSRWGPSPKNVLLIDAGGPKLKIKNAFVISAAERSLVPALDDPMALDRIAKHLRNMDEVIVSCPLEHRYEWSVMLKGAGVHGEVTSGVAEEIGAIGIVHRADSGISTLLVSLGPLAMRARVVKRGFDVATAVCALLALSPILLLTALAIKLEDGGPVFFKQMRIGRRNSLFPIYKFRSMRVEQGDGAGARSTDRNDDRVTRVGRFIRKTSIDELPQLLNVLNGSMSLVGPRPHAVGSLAGDKLFWEIDRRYWLRHSLRPGLTGLAQVRGFRGATDHEGDLSSRLMSDLEYLQDWSLLKDISILLATLKVLVHDRAY